MSDTKVNPWDRLATEHDAAWVAFQRYRDGVLPRPSVAEYAPTIGYAATRVSTWARVFMWTERLLAWDRSLDARRQVVAESAVEEMARRHVAMSRQLQSIAMRAVEKIAEDLESDLGRMNARDAIRIYDIATKSERISRGEATERVAGVDYSRLTSEELLALEKISKKI